MPREVKSHVKRFCKKCNCDRDHTVGLAVIPPRSHLTDIKVYHTKCCDICHEVTLSEESLAKYLLKLETRQCCDQNT